MENEEITKIFIDSEGILNKGCKGQLASIEDLQEEICCSGKTFEGILQLQEGQFIWMNAEQQRKILEFTDSTENELEECEGKYVQLNNNVPEIYKKFVDELDDDMNETVISCTFCDRLLIAVTKMVNDSVLYVYNMYYNERNEIDGNINYIYKQMLENSLI